MCACVLACLASALAAGPVRAQVDREFTRVPALEPNVAFWKKVYIEWSLNDIAIGDDEDLSIIYRVIKVPARGAKNAAGLGRSEAINKGQAEVLIQAHDGSERGKAKLYPPGDESSLITCLSAGELGLSFGRERAIHAALAAGGLTVRVVEEAARLAGLRPAQKTGQVGGRTAGKDTKDA